MQRNFLTTVSLGYLVCDNKNGNAVERKMRNEKILCVCVEAGRAHGHFMNVRPGSCLGMLMVLQDNSPPDCLHFSRLKKVAYLGKVGGVVPSTWVFFHSDRKKGIVACHRPKPAFLSSVSEWKFCSYQGNIVG